MMTSIILALIGGALIGLAAVGYLYVNGRVAGVSGLIAQLLQPKTFLHSSAFWFFSRRASWQRLSWPEAFRPWRRSSAPEMWAPQSRNFSLPLRSWHGAGPDRRCTA